MFKIKSGSKTNFNGDEQEKNVYLAKKYRSAHCHEDSGFPLTLF